MKKFVIALLFVGACDSYEVIPRESFENNLSICSSYISKKASISEKEALIGFISEAVYKQPIWYGDVFDRCMEDMKSLSEVKRSKYEQ